MSFGYVEKGFSPSTEDLKKINKYNEQKRKSVIFTTPGEIICRTMFLSATADEIYGMMEEIVNALEEL